MSLGIANKQFYNLALFPLRNSDYSETTESSKRKKRAASVVSGKKTKKATVLKKTNAANSMLGLSVVLYPNEDNYDFGVVMNNYIGFKALVSILIFL